MIRLPPARSRVDLKLAHDGVTQPPRLPGWDGGTEGRRDDPNSGHTACAAAESAGGGIGPICTPCERSPGTKSRVTCDSSGEAASMSATTTRSIIRCAGLLARRGRGAIEVRSRRPLRQSGQPGHAGSAPGPPGSRSSPKSGRSRPAPDPCRAYASELGRNLESRVTRIGPALLEPLARFSGPLPVSAASSSQIESSPVATKREPTEVGSSDGSDPSRARHAGRDAAKPR